MMDTNVANAIYILVGALVLFMLISGLFRRRGGNLKPLTKAQRAEQVEFAERWDKACETRTRLGLHPSSYDINALDNYRADPPTETAEDAIHRAVHGLVGEARDTFKGVKR